MENMQSLAMKLFDLFLDYIDDGWSVEYALRRIRMFVRVVLEFSSDVSNIEVVRCKECNKAMIIVNEHNINDDCKHKDKISLYTMEYSRSCVEEMRSILDGLLIVLAERGSEETCGGSRPARHRGGHDGST